MCSDYMDIRDSKCFAVTTERTNGVYMYLYLSIVESVVIHFRMELNQLLIAAVTEIREDIHAYTCTCHHTTALSPVRS